MKNLSFTRLVLVALLILSGLKIFATEPDFQVNGIYYKITSIEERECSVYGPVYPENNPTKLIIPTEVTYNGASFTVVSVFGEDQIRTKRSRYVNVKELILPNSVKVIEFSAFYNVQSLERVQMDGVKYISSNAFENCVNLKSISMKKVEFIGFAGFSDCRSFEKIIIPPSCKKIEKSAFLGCVNPRLTVVIEDSDEPLLCNSTFGSGRKIYIGRNIQGWYGLGDAARHTYHNDIYYFKEIEFGDKVTEMLGINLTRRNYDDLENFPFKITIGASIREVPDFANDDMTIQSLYLVSAVPPRVKGAFSNRTYLHGTLYVPKGSLAAYKDAPVWKNFLNIQEYETDRTIAANKEYFAQRKKEEAQKAEAKRKAEEEAKHKAEAREAAAKRTMDAMEAAERYAKEIEDRMKARQEQERDLSHIDSTPNETQVPKKSQNSANRNSQTLMPVEKSKGKSQPEIDILDMNNTTPFNVIKWKVDYSSDVYDAWFSEESGLTTDNKRWTNGMSESMGWYALHRFNKNQYTCNYLHSANSLGKDGYGDNLGEKIAVRDCGRNTLPIEKGYFVLDLRDWQGYKPLYLPYSQAYIQSKWQRGMIKFEYR